jgi:hypothetical protein
VSFEAGVHARSVSFASLTMVVSTHPSRRVGCVMRQEKEDASSHDTALPGGRGLGREEHPASEKPPRASSKNAHRTISRAALAFRGSAEPVAFPAAFPSHVESLVE